MITLCGVKHTGRDASWVVMYTSRPMIFSLLVSTRNQHPRITKYGPGNVAGSSSPCTGSADQ